MQKYYYVVQIVATVLAWIMAGVITYGALKQDITVVKIQQLDDRHYIEQRLDSIDKGIRDLNERMNNEPR